VIRINENQFKYFTNLWLKHRSALTVEQKDGIGIAYLKHIIGADEKTIQVFLSDDLKARDYIGLRQGCSKPRKKDYDSFWKEVARITQDYIHDDLDWLIKSADVEYAHIMIFQIDEILKEKSSVIKKINVNAHVYK
jgi:hypothetical protein